MSQPDAPAAAYGTLLLQAFEQSPRASAIVLPDSGRVLYSNPAFRELVGSGELSGDGLRSALADIFPCAADDLDRIAREGTPIARRAVPAKVGGDLASSWWDIDFTRLDHADADGLAVLIAARDVTSHVLSKRDVEDTTAALTSADDKLRLAQAATGFGLWEWDLEADRLAWSPEQFRLHGLEHAGRVPPTFAEWLGMVHSDDRHRMTATAQQATPDLGGDGATVVFRINRADTGEERWLLSKKRVVRITTEGRVACMAGVTLDITDRRQEQQVLAETEARLRLAFGAGHMFAWEWDLQTGRMTWPRSQTGALGQPVGMASGNLEEALERVHPEDLPRVRDALRKVADNEADDYQAMFRVRRPDGGECWSASSGVVVRDEAGRALRLVGIDQDVTRHRAAESALRERQRQQAAIARLGHFALGAGSALAVMDEAVRIVASTLEVEFCKVLELEPGGSDFLLRAGMGWSDAYPVGSAKVSGGPASQAGFAMLQDDGPVIVADLGKETRFSSPRLLVEHGIVSGLSVIIRGAAAGANFGVLGAHTARQRDFTEHDIRFLEAAAHIITTAVLREQTETALKEGDRRFSQFACAVDDVLWVCELDGDGTIYVSSAFERVFGSAPPPQPCVLKAWEDAIHAEDRDRVIGTFANKHLTAGFEMEYRIVRPDGELRWVHDRAWPIVEPEGQPGQIARVASDVTAMVRARHAAAECSAELERRISERTETLAEAARALAVETRRREDVQEALVQSQKLEALGLLTSGVAHDINNVLTAIGGSYSLIRRRTDLKAVIDLVQLGERAAERAQQLIAQLLAFAHKREVSPQTLYLDTVLADAADLVHHAVGFAIGCQFEIAEAVWPVIADAHQLGIAVLNLAVNARDAMPDGGSLIIGARNLSPGERPETLGEIDCVVVFVRDTGLGMPPEVVARVTEPFFTTKPVGQGTGLGLAMVHSFAQKAGGCLRIDSRQGVGTTVEIILPRAAVQAAPDIEQSQAPVSLDPAPHGNATILFVEGDDQVRPLTAAFLRSLGYTVVEAATAEASKALGLTLERLDLLVSDASMPGDGGAALAVRLRIERPDLPALFTTARDPGPALEAERVLRKPFAFPELADAVLERLGRTPGASRTLTDRLFARLRDPALRRLYAEWRQKRAAGARLPVFGSVQPEMFGLRPHAFQVEIIGTDAPVFRFMEVGKALTDRLGRDPQLDLGGLGPDEEEMLGTLEGAYRQCAGTGAPYYEMARYDLGDGSPVQFERLVLPFSTDGEHVSHLLGVALFK